MLGGALGGASLPLNAARKPNLIVFLADDLGYGDIGCYGSPDVPTLNIDRLARGGVRFTDGYVSAAVCSPSRVALLTGQYQQRFGHEFNSGPIENEARIGFGLPKAAKILPEYLKSSGYVSGAFGKWHLGARRGYHPMERGFDEFYGFLPGADDYVTTRTPGGPLAVAAEGREGRIPAERAAPLLRGREIVTDDRYLTDALGREAVQFIERHHGDPFFLYLAFNAIHAPLQGIGKYLDRFPNIKNERHRMLAAMTTAMDDAIGGVIAKVRERGLERDTMVVFLSDNGCPEITAAGTNGPLNGEKVTYFEGGIRVPYMLRWPGRLPEGKTYREAVVSRDIVPTFLNAAGVSSGGTAFDGVDLLPFLRGQKSGSPHDALFWRAGNGRAVRMGRWKLVEFGGNYSRLFDLSNDLGETKDLSTAKPQVVRELKQAWSAWSSKMLPPAWPARHRELVVNGEKINWEL